MINFLLKWWNLTSLLSTFIWALNLVPATAECKGLIAQQPRHSMGSIRLGRRESLISHWLKTRWLKSCALPVQNNRSNGPTQTTSNFSRGESQTTWLSSWYLPSPRGTKRLSARMKKRHESRNGWLGKRDSKRVGRDMMHNVLIHGQSRKRKAFTNNKHSVSTTEQSKLVMLKYYKNKGTPKILEWKNLHCSFLPSNTSGSPHSQTLQTLPWTPATGKSPSCMTPTPQENQSKWTPLSIRMLLAG